MSGLSGQGAGVTPSGSGCQPTASAAEEASSQSGIPNAARIWLSGRQVAGTVAMWAIRQSPYPCPDNLETVIDGIGALWPSPEPFGLSEWSSVEEIEDALQAVFAEIPALVEWNSRRNGNSAPFGFRSRYDKPHPDDDFIDLGALWGNVARSLWAEESAYASGTEAQRATTVKQGVVHDGPGPEGGRP